MTDTEQGLCYKSMGYKSICYKVPQVNFIQQTQILFKMFKNANIELRYITQLIPKNVYYILLVLVQITGRKYNVFLKLTLHLLLLSVVIWFHHNSLSNKIKLAVTNPNT